MSELGTKEVPIVSLRNVVKTYMDGAVVALDHVSLDVAPHEFVCVTGPSGCGKSTMLNMLGALDRPTSGEVLFRGEPITAQTNLDALRSKEIGFVFQAFYLLPNLTAEENVQLPMIGSGLRPRQRAERARELLQGLGLGERLRHLPHQLSIGQRQRVAIARSLANNPSLILADEPTGNLDSANGEEVLQTLRSLHRDRGATVVLITHDPNIAELAQRRISMRDGRIIADAAS